MSSTATSITDGPSKWDLALALFDRSMVNSRRATFTWGGTKHSVRVHSVEAEDGSGESWNIKGNAWPCVLNNKTTCPPPSQSVMIYFRTDKRKGVVTLAG